MGHFEKQLDTSRKYEGIIVNVRVDGVELEDGSRAFREVVEHPGGVGIVPIDENGCVLMVRQFRYPFGMELLEIPAGKLERGEDPFECAKRELSEETGCTAEHYVDLGYMCSTPGFCEERLYIYLAYGLTYGEMHLDEGEFLTVERVPLDTLVEMIAKNEIPDAKTVFGILKAKLFFDGRK